MFKTLNNFYLLYIVNPALSAYTWINNKISATVIAIILTGVLSFFFGPAPALVAGLIAFCILVNLDNPLNAVLLLGACYLTLQGGMVTKWNVKSEEDFDLGKTEEKPAKSSK